MIPVLFNILLFLIPLIFFKNTSELFEFNKIITLYLFTILIVAVWAYNSITHKRFIFRRTILDTPLILYLLVLFISTLFSTDPRTSWLGYYSRFNGGLISQICYALLYWAYVSNLNKKQTINNVYYALTSTTIVSILAIGERFGIFTTCGLMGFGYSESCWVQDVQNRVFSTLGQPNWLAATITALIPMSWYFLISDNDQFKNRNAILFPKIFWFLISVLLFVALLFTKSRSGFLAFGIETVVFWSLILWQYKFKKIKELVGLIFISFALVFLFNKPVNISTQTPAVASPVLETGGTESGTIRKYVWLGAMNIFKKYPLFGSGPETFAFVFPNAKPIGHNLTSEWDFIYNKAHNEYLNYLATTGLFGLIAYAILIVYSLIAIWKTKNKTIMASLISGYFAILVTNFFGFSVVYVSLLFFILPAIALTFDQEQNLHLNHVRLGILEKILILIVFLLTPIIIFNIFKYWQADTFYNNARNSNRQQDYENAKTEIEKAINISKNESIYWAESAVSYAELSLTQAKKTNETESKKMAEKAELDAIQAVVLSPKNINNLKILSSTYYKFSIFSNDYLTLAEEPLINAITVAPNDPKLHYQLGVLNLKNGKIDEGLFNIKKSVELKPNYKEGRFALGLTYIDTKNYQGAIENLEYILQNIDPNDELTKKYLDKISQ
ncbi:MAG: O-antigen ligase family protein [Microgenomates group bacterium]